MLKFADLSVDFKSYDNSLNSYMKLFPNSYTPLLIMYLAHEGLLKLVYEFEENDPRILVSVDGWKSRASLTPEGKATMTP